MRERIRLRNTSKYLILIIIFLLIVNVTLGYLLMRQSKSAMTTLLQTKMLDISNTAAAMIDGDVLKTVTPADEGSEGYEAIMRTLTYFQDNIDLKYIYCVRDMGDGSFTFGLDPTVEDPGEFGSSIVYTEALYRASKGTPSADEEPYEDAWGAFYSAYSPVYDSRGALAGIIAVDFDAAWYNQQIATLTRTTIIVGILSLLLGGGIVTAIVTRSERRIGSIQGQLSELENTLMEEMGNLHAAEHAAPEQDEDPNSLDSLGRRIQTMQTELKEQIAHVHGQAYQDGLTGVKSKHAYLKMETEFDESLGAGEVSEFAVVVCDVNGLKKINDTLGHNAGDEYIRKACKMICDIFAHSPVYRVGGDEFVAILTGRDYENRRTLMRQLHERSAAHIETNDAIVSGGMAEYVPGQDRHLHEVFERADGVMYEEKMLLKRLGAATREDEAGQAEQETEDIPALRVRKHVLIADDVAANREILGDILQEDYDILYAADGVETLEILRERKDEVALLLLDLYMPKLSGQDVMTEMQVDTELLGIPVIVLTVDREAELLCLKLGAMDFIPKPYPDAEIIKTRVAKCVELSENRELIRYTQRDKLTGLYNVDYFFRYVNRFDQQYKDAELDAVVCDVNDFYAVNEQYGRQFGDMVLRSVGISFRKLARKTNGIACRKGADTFLLYCPHRGDYEVLLRKNLTDIFIREDTAGKVGLRFGVYAGANQEPDAEKRFACAAQAANSVKNDPDKVCGFYTP